jgi:hypothetical protein
MPQSKISLVALLCALGIGKTSSVFSTTDTRRSEKQAPTAVLGSYRGLRLSRICDRCLLMQDRWEGPPRPASNPPWVATLQWFD